MWLCMPTYMFWEEFPIFVLHCPVLSKYIVKLVYHCKRGDKSASLKPIYSTKLAPPLKLEYRTEQPAIFTSRQITAYVTLPGQVKFNLSELPSHFASRKSLQHSLIKRSCFDHFNFNFNKKNKYPAKQHCKLKICRSWDCGQMLDCVITWQITIKRSSSWVRINC